MDLVDGDAYEQVAGTIEVLQNLRLVTIFHLAAAVLLIHDYLLTFSMEVRLIWPAPMNIGKILYILTRLLPFLDMPISLSHEFIFNPSPNTCYLLYRITACSFLAGVAVADVVLIIRTCALWGNNKKVKYFLIVLFVAVFIPAAVAVNLAIDNFDYTVFPAPTVIPGCYVVSAKKTSVDWYSVYYGLLPVFETAVFLLTIVQFKTLKAYKNHPSVFVKTLYRDGVLFYLYLNAISITYLIILLKAPKELANLLFSTHRVIHSLLSSRLLLNLRAATLRTVEGTGLPTTTFAMFASRYFDPTVRLETIRFNGENGGVGPESHSDETELTDLSTGTERNWFSTQGTSNQSGWDGSRTIEEIVDDKVTCRSGDGT